MYHSSALLAAALDTTTLPYRRETDASLITHLTSAMSPVGRKVSQSNTITHLFHFLNYGINYNQYATDSVAKWGFERPRLIAHVIVVP